MRLTSFRLAAPALLLLLTSTSASATAGFPGQIRNHLTMDAAPSCNLCHATGGGGGRMTTPFGVNLQDNYGLLPNNNDSLLSALDDAEANGDDVDGDGTPDMDELRNGTDPNVNEKDPNAKPVKNVNPQYGFFCGANGAAEGSVAALLVGLSLVRRRRATR